MNTKISIAKADLIKHSYLGSALKSFCQPVTESGGIMIYVPLPEKLWNFLNLLTQLEISYSVDFKE